MFPTRWLPLQLQRTVSMLISARTALLTLMLASARTAAQSAPASGGQPDSVETRQVLVGVEHTRIVRASGPWIINVLRIDLRRSGIEIKTARAHGQLRSRERLSELVRRAEAAGTVVVAAINADFFNLKSGESENNQVIDGEWWKGVKVTDSPYDTFRNPHAQFGVDSARRPLIDRYQFDGIALTRTAAIPLIALNAIPTGPQEGSAFYTPRFGTAAPVVGAADSSKHTVEAVFIAVGQRLDTALYVRHGAAAMNGGSAIPTGGAVLTAYGPRSKDITAIGEGDTLKVVLRATVAGVRPVPLAQLIGGWPQIIRDGANIAGNAAATEGALSSNAEVRHPRSAIGFSRDSATLFLVVVDGRSRHSVGMTLIELAEFMRSLGAYQALNFDGGGSSTLIVQGKIVNSPSDVTLERGIGNAVLITRPKP